MRLPIVGVWLAAMLLVAAGCAGSKESYPSITTDPTHVEIPGKVVWVDLITEDLEGSKKFYGDLFGWSFEPVADNYVTITLDGARLGGMLEVERKDKEHVSQWLTYISVADVDASVEFFESNEGELHYGPVDIAGRGRAALVTDSQGGYVALIRSDSGDPPDNDDLPGQHEFMWVDYVANDTDQAIEFLGNAFGWKSEVHTQKEDRSYYVFKQGDEYRAGLFENPWSHVRPNWLAYVRVADAREAVDRATSLGGSVVLEPAPDIRNGSVAIIQDPFGAAIALQKYPFKESS